MKKKLIIIVIILLASGGVTWAVFNQAKKNPSQPDNTQQSTQPQTVPGGRTITSDQPSQPQKNTSAESSTPQNQSQTNPSSIAKTPAPTQNNSQQSNTNHSSHNNASSTNNISNQSNNPSNHSNNNSNHRPAPSAPQPPAQPNIPQNPAQPNTPAPQQPGQQPQTPPQTQNPQPQQPNKPTPQQPNQPPAQPDTPTKAQQIINQLKSSTNNNVTQFTNDDQQIRTVLWTKGITGPRLGAGGDFKRVEEIHGGQQFITYATGYRNEFLTAGWYDTDKTHGSSNVDRLLCFGAVAANQLHWWMNYHKDRVEQFIVKTNYRNNLPPSQRGTFKDLTTYQNSFKGQQNSRFFKMISLYFGNNSEGYYADPLIDMFINGHKPKPGGGYNDPDWPHSFQMDSRGGFFHDVFGKRNLTRRLVPSDFNDFTNEMKKAFRDGESVGIIHHTSAQNTHIITAWGLEYDLDGQLVAVYITDSDDQDDTKTGGMKRYNIKNVNNRAVMSTNITNPKAGSLVDRISTLGLGEDKWNNFLK